jgi:hypothetical protein
MATLEHPIQQRILIAHGSGDTRLWRNNVGTGWTGQATRVSVGNLAAMARGLRPGDVVIRAGRPLHAGLCIGSSDLIGLRSLVVGPELVGQRIARFAAVEVKSPTGRLTREQTAFIETVKRLGGLAGPARSPEEAAGILAG